MKSGIVSDVHGQPEALSRTLGDAPSVYSVFCAGDVTGDDRFCAQTVESLRRARAQYIQGNHETGFFGGRNPDDLSTCQRDCDPEVLAFLASAPWSLGVEVGGGRVRMV